MYFLVLVYTDSVFKPYYCKDILCTTCVWSHWFTSLLWNSIFQIMVHVVRIWFLDLENNHWGKTVLWQYNSLAQWWFQNSVRCCISRWKLARRSNQMVILKNTRTNRTNVMHIHNRVYNRIFFTSNKIVKFCHLEENGCNKSCQCEVK